MPVRDTLKSNSPIFLICLLIDLLRFSSLWAFLRCFTTLCTADGRSLCESLVIRHPAAPPVVVHGTPRELKHQHRLELVLHGGQAEESWIRESSGRRASSRTADERRRNKGFGPRKNHASGRRRGTAVRARGTGQE